MSQYSRDPVIQAEYIKGLEELFGDMPECKEPTQHAPANIVHAVDASIANSTEMKTFLTNKGLHNV